MRQRRISPIKAVRKTPESEFARFGCGKQTRPDFVETQKRTQIPDGVFLKAD
jgi:hypothetical protein